jgi:tetratricopeptide (TPR) repeat protein
MEHVTLSGIAQVAEVRQNWKEAEAKLRKLLQVMPEDLVAYQRLARSLFWQGPAGQNVAYDVLRKAKEIDRAVSTRDKTREEVLTPEAIMGKYYADLEGPTSTKPKVWFEAALKNAPKDLATRQAVAVWALEKGNISLAKEQAEAILNLEKSDVAKYSGSNVGRMLRGLVALWEKDWPEAEKDFESIILEDRTNFAARNNLALALVAQKERDKKQKGLALAEANYRDNPNHPDALSTYAWASFQLGEFDQAWLTIKKCVELTGLAKLDPDARTYLAYILDHQDKKWEAKQLLESVKSGPAFAMRDEALELYKKLKDVKNPEAKPPATTPSGPAEK